MYDCILFVLADEQKHIIAKIEEKNILVIFDGTTRSGEVLAVVIGFVAEWKIKQHLIHLPRA